MIVTDHEPGIASVPVARFTASATTAQVDALTVEEPLEILLTANLGGGREQMSVAVTMRTPGDDEALAAGFLFTESILADPADIEDLESDGPNRIRVTLGRAVVVDPTLLDRQSFVASSCGVCGKRSIAAVWVRRRHRIAPDEPRLDSAVIHGLPAALQASQPAFAQTGGIHAAALFDDDGRLLDLREDIGRHNALDKLIGAEFLAGRVPLDRRVVLVSGRASFELVQKAALAAVPVLAAIGAPSTLAVDLARECGMTLLGFVRDGRFNLYTGADRVR